MAAIINIKKLKLFLISVLVAFVVLLNFYMLGKVITNKVNPVSIENSASFQY